MTGGSPEFLVLGPLEVRVGSRRLPLGAAKQRGLLAILLLHANEVVSSDRLVEELWGERPPATAAHSVHVYVSQLRKELGALGVDATDILVTRPPGYLLRVAPEQLDLVRFERLVRQAEREAAVDPAAAAELLREALALWRGPPLADLVYETFAQPTITRLEELRLVALERRIEADLRLGRHRELVGELEALGDEYPLRESLCGQLMLALYRSGRQAEALEAYRRFRRALVDGLGIEPSRPLQELERAILRQDPSLDVDAGEELRRRGEPTSFATERSILVVLREEDSLEPLLLFAEPLARRPARELILAWLVGDADGLRRATAVLHERRAELLDRGVATRAAAFTSSDPGSDAVRLASQEAVDLLLLEAPPAPAELAAVLERAPCDVGVLLGRGRDPLGRRGAPVLVPFGGAEHDWAAVELGAWLARNEGLPLRLLGIEERPLGEKRDASRLLASVSLAIQGAAGIAAEPLLVAGGTDAVLAAAEDAGRLVVGLSSRWRLEGIGATRLALAAHARAATLLVRRGLRPGGLAPSESLSQYTWSMGAAPISSAR